MIWSNSKLIFINFFVTFRFIDLISTYIVIQKYHGVEQNIFGRFIIDNFGWYGLTILVSAFCLFTITSLYLINKSIWTKIKYPIWILNIINLIGPINNLYMLTKV